MKVVFMKTRTRYECEICGNESTVRVMIEVCEAQGRRNKFAEGDKVTALVETNCGGGLFEQNMFRGSIGSIFFVKAIHEVRYFVVFDIPLPHSVDDRYPSFFSENDISSISAR